MATVANEFIYAMLSGFDLSLLVLVIFWLTKRRQVKMRPLSPELAKIAREEVNETPERIEQDLSILRVWISQQKHLKARTSDDFLIAFLRRCRYSLEETKKRIEKFYNFYTVCPEMMAKRRVTERILDINRTGIYYYPEYPKCTNQTALLIARMGQFNPMKFPLRDTLQFFAMALEIMWLESDNATVSGICEIFDMSGMSMERLHSIDLVLLEKFAHWMVHCCPVRIKEVYILNGTKQVQRLFSWRKNSFRDLPMKVLKSQEELYEYIPRDCLPEEYGGSNGHIWACISYMEEMLKSYRFYFEEDYRYGIRENLRLGKVIPYEAEFGVNGSFRKLSND